MNRYLQKPTETSKESKEPEMTVSQMEEAKNAAKFLPPRVRFSFCTTGGTRGTRS